MPFDTPSNPARELELKYSFDNFTRKQVLQNLKSICRPDNKFKAGVVNSIYFDTHEWLLAMEKASSDFLKTKVRVRWYNFEDAGQVTTSNCFFEVKRKIGTRREKIRVPLDINGTDIQANLSEIIASGVINSLISKHAPELSGHNLKPKCLISYQRHRFIEPTSNSRIALDANITAQSVGTGLDIEATHIELPFPVLEVKGYADELPNALRFINAPNLYKAAFSKYFLCFQSLTGYAQ